MNEQTDAPSEQTMTVQQAVDLGVQHHNAGDLPTAESIYQQVLKAEPNQPVALHLLGVIAHQVGKNDIAVDLIGKALTIKTDYAEAHNSLGNTLKDLGNLDDAVASYHKAIDINHDYADSHYNLAITLKEQGKLDDAVASYRKTTAIMPEHEKAHNNLGSALQEQGKLEEAISRYNTALAIKPEYAEAHYNLGSALHEHGKQDEAVTSYHKALAIKPDFSEARFGLGISLYTSNQYKKAAEQFKLSNFENSKSYLLKCLYQQDEQALFYDQLDFLISQGKINPIIGSLCSCSKIRYGVNRTNPFCNDPLKYVLKSNLTEQCDFKRIFVETSKNILNGDNISYKSQNLLTNGHQTTGNLLLLQGEHIDEIKKIIDSEIEKYRFHFKDSEEGFLRHWPTAYSLHAWLISMKSGGELQPHIHEEGWISGSIYINVPPKLKTDSGNLVVCIDDEWCLTNEKGNQNRSIDVVTGSLCLFPASLYHYTIPFESDEERIVLAFDVIPKQLTY